MGWRQHPRATVGSVILLVGLAAGLWWWNARQHADKVTMRSPAPERARRTDPAEWTNASARPVKKIDRKEPSTAQVDDRPLTPIIDKVTVEKNEVCIGEENLVTVRAHTTDGREDAYLHAVIGGQSGMVVPLLARQGEGERSKPALITVFGRNNVATSVEVPSFTVKDCNVRHQLLIELQLRPNTESHYELRARTSAIGADEDFVATYYAWDFGDGEQTTTDRPFVIHDYGRRLQDALYSQFVIRVEAVSAKGESVVGRRTLALRNGAFVNLIYANTVTLMVELTPRFPQMGEDGVVRQGVRLWHHQRDPIHIERAEARRNFTGDEPSRREEVSVVGLLGTHLIPRDGVEIEVQLDTRDEPDVFSVDYLLYGKSAEGIAVQGVFSVMVPPPAPTVDNSIPVRDPLFRAKIRRSMALLGKKLVTEEEIARLEADGAFSDLQKDGDSKGLSPSEQTYGDMPPHPRRSGEPAPSTALGDARALPILEPED